MRSWKTVPYNHLLNGRDGRGHVPAAAAPRGRIRARIAPLHEFHPLFFCGCEIHHCFLPFIFYGFPIYIQTAKPSGHASFAPIEDFHWLWGSMTRDGGCRISLLHPSFGSRIKDFPVSVNSVNTVFPIPDIRISC
jgi:hypothetical protein